MKRIWAPWRSTYISKAMSKSACFLCDAAKAPKKDAANFVLLRGDSCLAILNRYPYNVGHAMIAPRRHVGSLDALLDAERVEMLRMAGKIQAALDREFRCDGHNLGINIGRPAGAGLPGHLHLHIVPRWSGDTNFMPILAETKVMPLSLGDVHKALARRLRTRK